MFKAKGKLVRGVLRKFDVGYEDEAEDSIPCTFAL